MNDGQAQLDTRALEVAVEARTLITAHIRECSETRAELLRKFEESKTDRDNLYKYIKDKTTGLNKIIWQGTVGLIVMLITIIGYFLVTNGLPSHEPQRTEQHGR